MKFWVDLHVQSWRPCVEHRFRRQTDFLWVQFPSCNFFTKPYRYERNERETQESHEWKQQLLFRSSGEKTARLDYNRKKKTRTKTATPQTSWVKSSCWRNKPGKPVILTSETTWAKASKGWMWDSWTVWAKTTANSRTKGKTDWDRVSRKPATLSSETWACLHTRIIYLLQRMR